MSKFFISYSSQNRDKVKGLVDDIKCLGHDVWFDEELAGGQEWWDEILERIREYEYFIFAVSPEAQDSIACNKELNYAFDLNKKPLPILVTDGISIKQLPPALSKKHVVNYIKGDKKAVLDLSKAIYSLPAPKPLPEPLPEPPELPLSNLGKIAEEIATSDTLNNEKQKSLLFDLEEALGENSETDEIRKLIVQFSKRKDLLANIGKKLDKLLKSLKMAPLDQRSESTKIKSTRKSQVQEIEDMALIKGGSFDMGDIFGDGEEDEKPVHEVYVDDFYLGKYPVTVGEYREFVNSTGYETEAERSDEFSDDGEYWDNPAFAQTDKHPVVYISWNDAEEFVKWKRNKTGLEYRLPTEAELEYAARSGGLKEKWSGIDHEGYLGAYAWYEKNSGDKTHSVGQKKPNKLGLYDMSGNVMEWCSDWYGENYYKKNPKENPKGPSSGESKVLRGGSWHGSSIRCRCAFRGYDGPGNGDDDVGFRCARTLTL